jgi:dihydropteroate synthase
VRWTCRDRAFELGGRALVMGVVNVTPDSFSDGGRHLDPVAALAHARAQLAAGADLVDLGAESTRPGAAPVAPEEQWRRLEPVIVPLAAEGAACLSVDTSSAWVAERALDAGARVVNDVTALGDPRMGGVVAARGAGLVLMHMQGTPATMQQAPHYDDVVGEVAAMLGERLARARAAGVADACLAIDPGIGFGKTLEHNLALLARLDALAVHGRPIVVGASRKGFLGALTGRPVDDRLEAGLAAHAIAVFQGAHVVRTHDVAATVSALRVAEALAAARAIPARGPKESADRA